MKILKKVAVYAVIISACLGVVTLSMHTIFKSEETTVLALSTDPKEDVEVAKIVLEEIRQEVAITSNQYEFSFLYKEGHLKKDADLWDKVKHGLGGKSIAINAYVEAELRSNLVALLPRDLTYDEQKQTLLIELPAPLLTVHLNTEKTKIDESFEALFSSGYSAENQLRIYHQLELLGKEKIEEEQPELLAQAKEDIEEGLTLLLQAIPEVKEVEITFKEN